jgi:riboflavin biosynthesis pyrimidine reductase
MLRFLGASAEPIDPLELVLADRRAATDRPWVLMNMISAVDGASAVDGVSSGLGDDDDLAMFKAIRSVPDMILVGANTVAAEDYSPVSLDPERRARRIDRGLAAVPVLAIVSGRLNIDPEARVFSNPEYRPMIITSTEADPTRLMMLGDAAEVVILDEMTPRTILRHLSAAAVVLLEGGPRLNGQFIQSGLVDEANLTISPMLVSGNSARIAVGPEAVPPIEMQLDRVLMGERSLFLRYLASTEAKEGDHGQTF